MATGNVQQPAPVIWQYPRAAPVFAPPLGLETLVGGTWTAAPELLLALGDGSDRTVISGQVRLTLPNGPLVLRGRGRGNPSGITLGGLPLGVVTLGLDAAPPSLPRGYHPWTARTDAGGVLILDTHGYVLSQLQARLR
jgi:hypothetical protein